jgi:hypothetical protein
LCGKREGRRSNKAGCFTHSAFSFAEASPPALPPRPSCKWQNKAAADEDERDGYSAPAPEISQPANKDINVAISTIRVASRAGAVFGIVVSIKNRQHTGPAVQLEQSRAIITERNEQRVTAYSRVGKQSVKAHQQRTAGLSTSGSLLV